MSKKERERKRERDRLTNCISISGFPRTVTGTHVLSCENRGYKMVCYRLLFKELFSIVSSGDKFLRIAGRLCVFVNIAPLVKRRTVAVRLALFTHCTYTHSELCE